MTDATQSLRELIVSDPFEPNPDQRRAWAAGFRLARFITEEGAEEALARIVDPRAAWHMDITYGQTRKADARTKARAILEVLSRAALGEG